MPAAQADRRFEVEYGPFTPPGLDPQRLVGVDGMWVTDRLEHRGGTAGVHQRERIVRTAERHVVRDAAE